MEQQNDERLESLYSKINSIKNVTIDIHSDSLSQNRILDQAGERFDSLGNQLNNSRNRFNRFIQSTSNLSQKKMIIYTVAFVIAFFFLLRLFR
ncbi:hypothetical protein O181_062577 [Austropuccinia psidii MF-1]|uniref:t-SNARE coiled-coil homology domain-containing protein n=1 Tax=Austropuccinia psidii MF-1 TaxID=1389203 RepID=A0A9Q3EMX1_9BASI|nr:hypothetical protein [Austropuccinia psidii MF-1]